MLDLYIRVYFAVTLLALVLCLFSPARNKNSVKIHVAGTLLLNIHILTALILFVVFIFNTLFGDT